MRSSLYPKKTTFYLRRSLGIELIKLLGVLIVIVGFALKLDSILIIFLALITTGIVGGLGVGGLLETIGTNFVATEAWRSS